MMAHQFDRIYAAVESAYKRGELTESEYDEFSEIMDDVDVSYYQPPEIVEGVHQLKGITALEGLEIGKIIREGLTRGLKASENAEKYKWHDLRKNPEDQPNNKTDYLVAIQWEDGMITYAVRNKKYLRYVEYSGADKCPYPYKVVAWKDIELFEDANE